MPLLTDVVIRQTKPPAAGRRVLWDSKVRGLALRITEKDARTWSVFYRNTGGENRRLTLGPYRPEESIAKGLTLGEARRRAGAVLRDVAAGADPQAVKAASRRQETAEARRQGATFADIAEKWLEHGRSTKGSRAGQPWRPKTRQEFERLVRTEIIPALGDLKPEQVTKAHVRGLYDRLEKRSASTAKHTLAVLKLLFAWAAEEDHVDAVPTFPRRATQSNKRTRVLEEGELRAVMKALDAGVGSLTEAFRLMLYTGQRRGEVLSMRWQDVTEEKGGAWWTVPAERAKGGRDHRVPLTAPAVEALKRLHANAGDEAWLFPTPKGNVKPGRKPKGTTRAQAPFVTNPQKAAAKLWEACGLKGSAHVHDLRRTAATYMVRLGVSRLVVARVLGHSDSDVTGRYDVHAYDREKRGALQKWADELARIAASKGKKRAAKVLPWVG
jgi:integrase